jgi:hypothetical protein
MNQQEFDGVVRQTIASIEKLLRVKGGEYAGSTDRLANFKRGASRTGAHPYQVLWIYLSKHLDSVETFIRKTVCEVPQELSEPIEGRLDDIINYCLLMKALVQETQGADKTSITGGGSVLSGGGVYPVAGIADAAGTNLQRQSVGRTEPGVDLLLHNPGNR